MLDVGTLLNERYEVKEKIGAGGMSIVYKAMCRKLERYVAIKVLRDEFAKDEEFVKSFRAEALAAASLSHPNIVGIYDVGTDMGSHYIVMEYVEGKTLKEFIEARAPYKTQQVLEYGISILSAIRHAHMKKIIHRDIKPQNILVTNDHILKVTDFGIARAVDSSTIVSTGTAIGSVHYFSPEQARGKYVDERSDLYSCGIVLFEMATGRLPFEADSHVSVALKQINDEIPLPTAFNKEISPTLEKIILKATEKRLDLRYASAASMLQDMLRLSSNPAYEIVDLPDEINQETILMTNKETEFIRQNSVSDSELDIPRWQATNPIPRPTQAVYSQPREFEPEEEEEKEEEEEISKTYTLMVSVAGVLAAFVLIGIITAFVLPWFTKMGKPKVVVVPNLIEEQVDKATEDLKEKGLGIEIVSEEETEGVPSGQILRQAPSRDAIVPIGTVIEVIVSKEIEVIVEEDVIVPKVTGMDFVDAQSDLSDLGIIMQITDRVHDDLLDEGVIISQNPMSGNSLEPGGVVSVTVSLGKEIITTLVPQLEGRDENTAISMLTNLGLKVGDINYEESETVEKGKVIKQTIPAGREVEPSSTISFVVSKGKTEEPPVEVSKTKNLTISIPGFLEEKEDYQVFIRLLGEDGQISTIFQGQVSLDNFPLTVQVKGTGKGTVETYIDNEPIYADPIDFDEVTQ